MVYFLKTFSTDLKSAWNSAFFDTQIELNIFFAPISIFSKVWMQMRKKPLKKIGKLSYNSIRQPSTAKCNHVVKIIVPYTFSIFNFYVKLRWRSSRVVDYTLEGLQFDPRLPYLPLNPHTIFEASALMNVRRTHTFIPIGYAPFLTDCLFKPCYHP